ncbi:TPA: hypothetical protein RQN04_002022 [Aeromonas hydrophila]|nr:hypothetical protein [Aeromonas hydrophila]
MNNAASLPYPVTPSTSLPVSALTVIRNAVCDAIVASSFLAYVVGDMRKEWGLTAHQPVQVKPARRRPARPARGLLGTLDNETARQRIIAQKQRDRAVRRQHEAAAPSMTGEQLVADVLDILADMQAEEAATWEAAQALPLPWQTVEGDVVVRWADAAPVFGAESTTAMQEALPRLLAFAGLEHVYPTKAADHLLPCADVLAFLPHVRGCTGRSLRKMVKGEPARLVA